MTLLNYWHYIALTIIFGLFVAGIVAARKQPRKKLVIPMILSITLISILLAVFSVIVIDKYTKQVGLYKVKNKRLLSIEKIVYTGIVKNEGNHEIGEVTFKIKIVNKGHATGNIKAGTFYQVNDLFDFFGGAGMLYKPQTITKEFVVARNLKPGKAKSFRVYFDYPPYFTQVSQYESASGH
jgi:hypothetical protein